MQFIYNQLTEAKLKRKKSFAVLVDPDKISLPQIGDLCALANEAGVDYFFIGGSLVVTNHLDEVVQTVKKESNLPTRPI